MSARISNYYFEETSHTPKVANKVVEKLIALCDLSFLRAETVVKELHKFAIEEGIDFFVDFWVDCPGWANGDTAFFPIQPEDEVFGWMVDE